ncbi:MAG: hypothetical protein GWP66_03145 [Gammaproteobacteria bacterium]|jgi:hypothetical protein|nr:hypothetical protein [Gammaproteobacteria bacterium]
MTATPDDSGLLEREMGLAHADFWRLLPQALGDLAWRAEGDRVRVEHGTGWIEIALGVEGERRIALMTIPVTEVTMRWEGVSRERFDAFLARFDSYYRRGGG